MFPMSSARVAGVARRGYKLQCTDFLASVDHRPAQREVLSVLKQTDDIENMEDVLDEVVSSEDLKKFERVYHEQLHASNVTQKVQFEYAWCLVRSKYPADIRKGIILLEDLFNKHEDTGKRDCLYYLAIGNARIKEYTKALSYVRAFLNIEPGNQQVQHLETLIKKKMEKEGLVGMAVAGGVIIGIASILGLGIAMAKKG